jgi:hypothetical protein
MCRHWQIVRRNNSFLTSSAIPETKFLERGFARLMRCSNAAYGKICA